MDEKNERDRGILTKDDRAYLRGERELSEGGEYNARRRIRRRVQNAILDIPILLRHLSDEDREKIARAEDPVLGNADQIMLRQAMEDSIVFLYLLYGQDLEETVEYMIDADLKKKELVGMANVDIEIFNTEPIEESELGEFGESFGRFPKPGGLAWKYAEQRQEVFDNIAETFLQRHEEMLSRMSEAAMPDFSALAEMVDEMDEADESDTDDE